MNSISRWCWQLQFGKDREEMKSSYTTNDFNEKLVDRTRQRFNDEEIGLLEFEKRLDFYLTAECPPEKIYVEDFLQLTEAFVHVSTDEHMLLGYEYKREGDWFVRQGRPWEE